ncbi:hypothetical protein GCM10010178_59100 [Lentzea flava]|uniref:HTH tetR-type domain-containing protein n=1 Tax=Lentzea flava TaxID=103732 RepID=A0ABQ2UYY5_9PSEU|nr:transcriptional regulator, TetR family [Lentzea flava]GGU59074.1 hypothetical protein GCM10010178_59100 [Lentzea flava]
MEEFQRFGLRRARVEDIVRRAGVGRMTVYRKYESKDRLIQAAVWREVRRAYHDGQLVPPAEAGSVGCCWPVVSDMG